MSYTAEQLDKMSDAKILELAAGYGPGIIGQAHFDRAAALRTATDDGRLGPALVDPDYARKQAALRGQEVADEETDDEARDEERVALLAAGSGDTSDPWTFVTLSGAKMLAQQHNVSYPPRVKRDALVAALKDAGVAPPAPPEKPATEDDFDDDDL